MTLTRATLGAVVLASQAGTAATVGLPIKPDWNLLFDFTANVKFDAKKVLNGFVQEAQQAQPAPHSLGMFQMANVLVGDAGGDIGVGFNLDKGFMDINAKGNLDTINMPGLPPKAQLVLGAKIVGDARVILDREKSYAAIRAHIKDTAGKLAGAGLDLCLKVKVPPSFLEHVLPPVSMVEKQEPKYDQQFAMAGKMMFTDHKIGGEEVAFFSLPPPPGSGLPAGGYIGMKLNAVPVGFDFDPPKDGKWSPVIDVTEFKAGTNREELYCHSSDTVISASELWAHPHRDIIMNHVDTMAKFGVPHYTMRPSEVFQALAEEEMAAEEEESLEEEAEAAPMNDAVYLGATGVAGLAAGALVTYGVLRNRRGQYGSWP